MMTMRSVLSSGWMTKPRRAANGRCLEPALNLQCITTSSQLWWSSYNTSTPPHGYYYNDSKNSKKKSAEDTVDWVVKLDQAVLRYPGSSSCSVPQQQQHPPLDFKIQAAGTNVCGGHALLGPNSSGKSLLVAALTGLTTLHAHHPHQGRRLDSTARPHIVNPTSVQEPSGGAAAPKSAVVVASVSFESHQRLLKEGGSTYAALTRTTGGGQLSQAAQFMVVRFGLYSLLTRNVTTLSTGEIRKVLLVAALSLRPRLLVLDNAFDGLDVASRNVLKEIVSKTIRGFRRSDILVQGVNVKAVAHTQVLMATHRAEEIVDEISTITVMKGHLGRPAVTEDRNGRTAGELVLHAVTGEDVSSVAAAACEPWDDPTLPSTEEITELWNHSREQHRPRHNHQSEHQQIVRVENFGVTRGDKDLLAGLNWSVRQGERWLVAGGNGAGKSSLSKFLTTARSESVADGEQYHTGSLNVSLSPDRVGWVSTERHMSLMSMSQSTRTAREVMQMGVDDNYSLSTLLTADNGAVDKVAKWLRLDEQEHHGLLTRPFAELSQGEQKLVLLASAMAKRPKLLIFDEPLQGLDLVNRRRVLGLMERICCATDTSVVYVTHHFDELIPSLTHALHLHEGRAIYNGEISAYNHEDM